MEQVGIVLQGRSSAFFVPGNDGNKVLVCYSEFRLTVTYLYDQDGVPRVQSVSSWPLEGDHLPLFCWLKS